jgi:hypothetical protein
VDPVSVHSFHRITPTLNNDPTTAIQMDGQPRSLRALFADAEVLRQNSETSGLSPISPEFQENLTSAIATYEECLQVASQVSLFSPNESLEDINSGDLQYLLINYHLAELIQRITSGNRKGNVLKARQCYESFLKLLDQYDMFSKSDSRMYEQYTDNPDKFATASTTDAQARRDTKIARFKEEKELKRKLEVCLVRYCLRRYSRSSAVPPSKPSSTPKRRRCPTRPTPDSHKPRHPSNLPSPRTHKPRAPNSRYGTPSTSTRPRARLPRFKRTRRRQERLFRTSRSTTNKPSRSHRSHSQQRWQATPALHTAGQTNTVTTRRIQTRSQFANNEHRRVLGRGEEAWRHD